MGIVGILAFFLISGLQAQQKYKVRFLPDVWYNNADLTLVGTRFRLLERGFGATTGKHQLEGGLQFSTDNITRFDGYLSLSEPILAWSSFERKVSVHFRLEERSGLSRAQVHVRRKVLIGFSTKSSNEWVFGVDVQRFHDPTYSPFAFNISDGDVTSVSARFKRIRSGTFWSVNSQMGVFGGIHKSQNFIGSELDLLVRRSKKDWMHALVSFQISLYDGETPIQRIRNPIVGSVLESYQNPFFRSPGLIRSDWMRGGLFHPKMNGLIRGALREFPLAGVAVFDDRYSSVLNTEWGLQPNRWLFPNAGRNLAVSLYVFSDLGIADKSLESRYMHSFGTGFRVGFDLPQPLFTKNRFSFSYQVPWLLNGDTDIISDSGWKYRPLLSIESHISF